VARIENRARLTDHGERELRAIVLDLAEVALAALSPSAGLRRSVAVHGLDLVAGGRSYDLSAVRRLVVLGAGKASAEVAVALEEMLGPRLDAGIVVVPHDHSARRPARQLRMLPAEHPVPGPASVTGARALLAQAAELGEQDLAICVFTGGSSALASLPPPGISPADKAALHRLLLTSGMSVVEINTVRKHVSQVKGGRLARAIAPARILNLTVSDVVGDPLDYITDPTVQDTSSVARTRPTVAASPSSEPPRRTPAKPLACAARRTASVPSSPRASRTLPMSRPDRSGDSAAAQPAR